MTDGDTLLQNIKNAKRQLATSATPEWQAAFS